MKNIRHSVFETNSSSTHSISIAKSSMGILDTIVPNEDGTIVLQGGEFGWQWEKYNDSLTKANYCAQHAHNNPSDLNLLVTTIKNHTGAKEVEFINLDNGYIDHQSVGTANDAFINEDTLKNFIFNPESWLFTGNDNDHVPPNFYDVDLGIEYDYELKIDDVELTMKFETKPSEEELIDALSELIDKHPLLSKGNYKNRYACTTYEHKLIDKNGKVRKIKLNSFKNVKNNKIKIYLLETIYNKGNFVGEKLKDTEEVKFKLINLRNN